MSTIPVMWPKLPTLERLSPYLKRIDLSRVYTNFGPLACSLEERLASHYGLGGGMVTTVANATLGLMLALTAQGARPGSLCMLPAWTFIASAHAAVMAGLVPYFVDVSPETWTIDAEAIADEIARAPAGVGAVMPVAPYGRPIDIASWDRFRARTGLPVVVDAAAGFDTIKPGETPVVVSLHATKVMGVGAQYSDALRVMYGRRPRCKRNLTISEAFGCGHVFGLCVRPFGRWP
jgi:dTDP-4-amino-4,6-dideoxygalactose transaminase